MKKKLLALTTGLVILCMTGMAQATLTTIGTANLGYFDYKLIWDDDNNGNSVIWLDYSRGGIGSIWSYTEDFAARIGDDLIYKIDAAYTVNWIDEEWRLPSAVDGTFQNGCDGTTTGGYNITSSEIGHLFYEELGNLASYDKSLMIKAAHHNQDMDC